MRKVSILQQIVFDLTTNRSWIHMADVLVFSTMTQVTEMKANYKKINDIKTDIKNTGLDEFLKFDNHG